MKANDFLFYHFYSHDQRFHSIPQTTKVETYQKAKDQLPTRTYLLGPRVWWVSPAGWGVEHIPSAALCPALWPKAQASLQGGLVLEFHSLGKEGYVPLAAGLPNSFFSRERMRFSHFLPLRWDLCPKTTAIFFPASGHCLWPLLVFWLRIAQMCAFSFSQHSLSSYHFLCLFHLILHK